MTSKKIEQGIIKPLRQRVKDLEEINDYHQKDNGKLRKELDEKQKKIDELIEKINDPLKKLRRDGII